jgi:hypothetical protein
MMTQSDRLLYGVEYEGTVHYDFELRLPTVADNIAALEEVGTDSNMKVGVAMFVRCLTKLGTIPAEVLTYDFIVQNMIDDDFDTLSKATAELKKKRLASNLPSPTTDSPSSSSDSTASPSPVSTS